MVIALRLWLFLSFMTGFLFGDPLFWRVGRLALSGHGESAYRCQCAQHSEYRQMFEHDGENVPQQSLTLVRFQEVFSSHMVEKPSFGQFLKSAGSGGIVSVLATTAFLCVTVYEHIKDQNVPALVFLVLASGTFCWGAYLAWSNERQERMKLEEAVRRPEIKGEILKGCIDTQIFENGAWRPLTDEICIFLYVRAVNHSPFDGFFGRYPTISISFGSEVYEGRCQMDAGQYLALRCDDPALVDQRVLGLFQSVWVNGADWLSGRPRMGWLCFLVPGICANIMKSEIHASITVTLYDSLENSHRISIDDIVLGKAQIK